VGGHKTISASVAAPKPVPEIYTKITGYIFCATAGETPLTMRLYFKVPGKLELVDVYVPLYLQPAWKIVTFENLVLTDADLDISTLKLFYATMGNFPVVNFGGYLLAEGYQTKRLDPKSDIDIVGATRYPTYGGYWDKLKTPYSYPGPCDTLSYIFMDGFSEYAELGLSVT